MGYAKLFSSITESSLWSEPKEVRLLFVTMLARADSTGFVEASVPGLARVSNLSVDETTAALVTLEKPDPHSKDLDRAPENEGRRLAKVPGGWMVLNYEEYRNRDSDDDRREYMREYMRGYREKRKQVVITGKQSVNDGKEKLTPLGQAETEAKAETPTTSPYSSESGFSEFWQAYPRRQGKGDAEKAWKKLRCDKLLPKILVTIRALKISEGWTKDGGKFIPFPATWLNRKGWEDEVFMPPPTEPDLPDRTAELGPCKTEETFNKMRREMGAPEHHAP